MKTLYKIAVNPAKTIVRVTESGAPVDISLKNLFTLITTLDLSGGLSVGGSFVVSGSTTLEALTVNGVTAFGDTITTPEIIAEISAISTTDAGGGISSWITTSATQRVDLSMTDTTTIDIPADAQLIGVVLRVDQAVEYTGAGTSFSADFTGGSSQNIASGVAGTLDYKIKKLYDVNAATNITSATTNIVFTPDADTFDRGKITVVVFYSYLDITTP